MNKNTLEALNKARNYFNNREFTECEWKMANIGCTLNTLMKYDEIEKIERVTREYYTVAELVEALNSCSGEDCYSGDWFYQIDENGNVYQEIKTVIYKMK